MNWDDDDLLEYEKPVEVSKGAPNSQSGVVTPVCNSSRAGGRTVACRVADVGKSATTKNISLKCGLEKSDFITTGSEEQEAAWKRELTHEERTHKKVTQRVQSKIDLCQTNIEYLEKMSGKHLSALTRKRITELKKQIVKLRESE